MYHGLFNQYELEFFGTLGEMVSGDLNHDTVTAIYKGPLMISNDAKHELLTRGITVSHSEDSYTPNTGHCVQVKFIKHSR